MKEYRTEFIKTWNTKFGLLRLVCNGTSCRCELQVENNKLTPIKIYDVDGLNDILTLIADTAMLSAYLSDTYVSISKVSDDSFSARIKHRIKGGANIINPDIESEKLWTNGIVPYEVDLKKYPVAKPERQLILEAISEWNAADTGFKLVPKTNQTDYLIFGEEEGVCYSNVGKIGGAQYIRCDLDGGGFNKRSIKHEIGHAVGFYHEHQRNDRDNYVKVNSRDRTNYGKEGNMHGEYDFNSIMHYHFNKELKQRPGVITSGAEFVGTQDRLSPGDISAARYLAAAARQSQSARSSAPFAFNLTANAQLSFFSEAPRISVYEKLREFSKRAFDRRDFADAKKYYFALAVEYGSYLSEEEYSDYCHKYGVCEFETGQYDSASRAFRKALEIDPGHPSARNDYDVAQSYMQTCNVGCVLL